MAIELPLSRESFETCLGHRFAVTVGAVTREVTLAQVQSLGTRSPGARESFSLTFESDDPGHWPQGTYDIAHPSHGSAAIFLVPIGPDPQSTRMRYQAIFS